MSERSEKVQEFRDIVEGMLAANIRRVEKGPGIPIGVPGYKKEASFRGCVYTSLDQRDARLHAFTFSESHLWGVTAMTKVLGRTAFMAIQSTADKDESLSRVLTINSAMQMITPSTQIELTEEQQLDNAVTWAKAPDLSDDAFERLSVIQPDEISRVQPRLDEIAGHAADLQRDLRELEENQRRAWEESSHIWIN